MSRVDECRLIELPKIRDHRGNLSFIEGNRHVPFDIQRVYYLYDVPGGEARGGHAHKQLQQLIIPLSGAFDVVLDDGNRKKRVELRSADQGLFMPTMIWRELENFTSGAVCLVLASRPYEEEDYYRDYQAFLQAAARTR